MRAKAAGDGARGWPRPSSLLLGGLTAAGPVVYPLVLEIASRRRAAAPGPGSSPEPHWPPLSVIVPAYLEGAVIADKIADLHRNGYRGELRVVVVTEDPDTAAAAREAGAVVIEARDRLGKAQAVNSGLEVTNTALAVLTDADTRLEPGSLAALVRHFEDPTVGAVAGEKRVRGSAQAAYWRYESWLKQRESELGTSISLVGELLALRRSYFSPLPSDTVVDDLWIALDVTEHGGRIPYEPAAIAWEDPSTSVQAEWERRTRTTAGLLDSLRRRSSLLRPGLGWVAGQLWGHKLLRLGFGPAAHLLLLAQALGASGRSTPARAFVVGHLLGAAAFLAQARGLSLPGPARPLTQALFLQATALGGIARFLAGERPALWPKADRSTGSTAPSE